MSSNQNLKNIELKYFSQFTGALQNLTDEDNEFQVSEEVEMSK